MIYKNILLLSVCSLLASCQFMNEPKNQESTLIRIENEEQVYSPQLGARFKKSVYSGQKGQSQWSSINGVEFFLPDAPDSGFVKYVPEDISAAENSASFFYNKINSPDKKWIVLPVGRKEGFVFTPTANTLSSVRQGMYQGRFSARTVNGTPLFHEFVRWESPSTFVFAASGEEGGVQFDEIFKINVNTGTVTQSPQSRGIAHVTVEKAG